MLKVTFLSQECIFWASQSSFSYIFVFLYICVLLFFVQRQGQQALNLLKLSPKSPVHVPNFIEPEKCCIEYLLLLTRILKINSFFFLYNWLNKNPNQLFFSIDLNQSPMHWLQTHRARSFTNDPSLMLSSAPSQTVRHSYTIHPRTVTRRIVSVKKTWNWDWLSVNVHNIYSWNRHQMNHLFAHCRLPIWLKWIKLKTWVHAVVGRLVIPYSIALFFYLLQCFQTGLP